MKQALIVDDSRLARHVLSKLLTEHGVGADAAESAEAALEYLKIHRPDVIFLDHMMPGMDGFEALEAIKANPLTATIPVMMYTSKEGELYVGQARALGALGVLPKNVEPVEVAKVLRSLRLIPASDDAQSASKSMPAAPQPLDARQLRELLAELFYEHRASLRDELARQLEKIAAANATTTSPAPVPAAPPARAASGMQRAYRVASVVLLGATAVFAYLYYTTSELLLSSHEQTRALATTATDLSAASARALGISPASPAAGPGLLAVLESGFNRGGQFAFGETPLDGARASVLAALLDELRRIDFAGTVALDVHVGRFCMNYGAGGELELAAPEQAAATCDQRGWPELEAVAMGQAQSLEFAYVVASAAKDSPAIGVRTLSHGSAVPRVPYPAGFDVTAADWNAVAARNQRVELRLVPAAVDAR